MGLRAKLARLEKAMQGNLSSIELADGSHYWFDPQEVGIEMFMYWSDSLHDPSMGQHGEAFGICTTPLDDLQFPPALLFAPTGQLLSRVNPVRPDLLQTRHKRL